MAKKSKWSWAYIVLGGIVGFGAIMGVFRLFSKDDTPQQITLAEMVDGEDYTGWTVGFAKTDKTEFFEEFTEITHGCVGYVETYYAFENGYAIKAGFDQGAGGDLGAIDLFVADVSLFQIDENKDICGINEMYCSETMELTQTYGAWVRDSSQDRRPTNEGETEFEEYRDELAALIILTPPTE